MVTYRTPETQAKYDTVLASGVMAKICPLCARTPLQLFTHWKIIESEFPYDRIAETHHMLVPLRHVPETELSSEEQHELQEIKANHVHTNYDFIMEASHRIKSIPAHFHLHVITKK